MTAYILRHHLAMLTKKHKEEIAKLRKAWGPDCILRVEVLDE